MVPFTLEGPAMLGGHAPVTVAAPGHIDHNHLAVTGHHHVHLAAGHHHLPAGHHSHLSAVHHHHSQLIPVPGHGGGGVHGPVTSHMHAPPHHGQAGHVHGIRYPPPQRGFTTVPPPHGSPTNGGLTISSHPPPSLQTANHILPPPGAYPRHELAVANRQLQPQPPQRLYLNKQQQQFRRKQKISIGPKNVAERETNSQEEGHKKILSAQELTGAPLISFASRNRKLKKKISEPSVSSTTKQSQNYYVGVYNYPSVSLQDMYQNPMYSQNSAKSTSALNSQQKTSYHSINQRRQEMEGPMKKTTSEPTFDSHSVSSEDLEHFLPRIIRPRRRRKKDRKEKAQQSQDELYAQRHGETQSQKGEHHSLKDADYKKLDSKTKTISVGKTGGVEIKNLHGHIGQEEPEMLGSEKQWLPQGLLSAESSYDSRSESGSSGEEAMISTSTGHRKLSAAMSMPVYPSYVAPIYFNPINKTSETSDYSSLTSNSSEYHSSNYNSSDTHGSDNQCDSDSRSEANSTPSIELEENGNGLNNTTGGLQVSGTYRHPSSMNMAARQEKPILVKSTSSSFFRSPKMSGRHDQSMNGLSPGEVRKRNLRKTNSWHPVTKQDDSMATFSLFSPAGSIDLLSGIRKNLSKLDINSETE